MSLVAKDLNVGFCHTAIVEDINFSLEKKELFFVCLVKTEWVRPPYLKHF